jgi:hypothetical protein
MYEKLRRKDGHRRSEDRLRSTVAEQNDARKGHPNARPYTTQLVVQGSREKLRLSGSTLWPPFRPAFAANSVFFEKLRLSGLTLWAALPCDQPSLLWIHGSKAAIRFLDFLHERILSSRL